MGAARSERPAMYHLDNVCWFVCGGGRYVDKELEIKVWKLSVEIQVVKSDKAVYSHS